MKRNLEALITVKMMILKRKGWQNIRCCLHFLHPFAIYEQASTELYLFSLSFNKKTNSWNIFSSGRIKDNKVFLYCWKHGHQYVFHVLSRGNLFKSFPSFLQPFVSLQQERNFLICGSRYWQNSTALHKLWSLFTLCQ